MKKQKLIIKVRVKIPSMGNTSEYLLLPYFLNGDNIYFLNSCAWSADGETASKAKANLKTNPEFVNIIDHLIDGIVINQGCYPAAELVNYIP
jgi:hypothetical protein